MIKMTAMEESDSSDKSNVISSDSSAVSTAATRNNSTSYPWKNPSAKNNASASEAPQTRFAFYHAAELASTVGSDDEKEKGDSKQPLSSSDETQDEEGGTAQLEQANENEGKDEAKEVEEVGEVDVNDILESLKETEASVYSKRKFSGYSSFDSENVAYPPVGDDGDCNDNDSDETDSKQHQQLKTSVAPTVTAQECIVTHGENLTSASIPHSQLTPDIALNESSNNDRENEILSSLVDSSPTAHISLTRKIESETETNKNQSVNKKSTSTMEAVVLNALNHLRARKQKRVGTTSPPGVMNSPSSPSPASLNTNNYNTLLKTPTSSNSSKQLQQNQNKITTQNSNARMADYTARLQSTTVNETDRQKTPPSNTSNVSNTSSQIPLPMHPSTVSTNMNNSSQSLINATTYDNRLLSPAIDVRKTVEGSDLEVFRRSYTNGQVNGPNIDLANPILSYIPGRTNSDGSVSEEINYIRTEPFASEQPEPQSKESPIPDPNNYTLFPSSSALGDVTSDQSAVGDTAKEVVAEGASGDSNTHSQFPQKWNAEEEIERGVESVLVAILEHAGKKADEADKSLENQTGMEYDDDGGDIIEKAFASLFIQQSSTSSFDSKSNYNSSSAFRRLRPLKREKTVSGQEPIRSQTSSVVEELLAEDDEDYNKKQLGNLQSSEDSKLHLNNMEVTDDKSTFRASSFISNKDVDAIKADGCAESDTDSVGGKPFVPLKQEHKPPRLTCSIDEDEVLGVEAIHELEQSLYGNGSRDSDDTRNFELEANQRVLGPLSKKMGGTTGVVLDNGNEDGSVDGRKSTIDHASNVIESFDNTKQNTSPSIINSLTSAVRNAPKILSVFSSDNLQSSPKILTSKGVPEDEDDRDSEKDYEASAMMKELCSHLLPYGVDKSTENSKKFSGWFLGIQKSWSTERRSNPGLSWNDDDPDELGFEVRELTKSQLRRVENEFENMVNNLRQNSERGLLRSNGSPSKNKNGLKLGTPKQNVGSNQEDDFERDLAEAENILDLEEQEHQAKMKSTPKEIKTTEDECDIDTKSQEDSVDLSASVSSRESDDSNPLSKNPFFPNAKAAGNGKIGELEVYHLPIIYKAKQTGFEPTKDLILQPGTIFAGQYFIQNELGSAAFSTAYRCVDLTSGKRADDGEEYYDEVCLKVIKNTKDFFDQSLDEIKILEMIRKTGQCEENNLVEMKAFFYHKEHLVIVTELLRQNLFEFGKYIIENEEPAYFTIPRLCYIVRQCLIALNFIHSLGLVHSDIKPENILLASYSRAKVKVIDFGSSCYLTDRQSSYIQSRSYRAPEVILGLPYDGKIDIWSLGCVIAEMYTGQVTFQNDSIVSMLSRIEAICGPFPRHMIANGRQSGQYFTQSGLLYEVVEPEDVSDHKKMSSISLDLDEDKSEDEIMYKIYQPKRTTISARLGFDVDLMEQRRTTWEDDEKAMFSDFVKKLLTINPDSRPTAAEALEHPWILSGYSMSEDSFRYPPEE